MLVQAWLLGGHIRIGMEDTVYLDRGVLATSNAQLVEKAVSIVRSLGGDIASTAEARAMLGLPSPAGGGSASSSNREARSVG